MTDRPAHGYADDLPRAVAWRLRPAEGTVYPALYRLERDGLVSSSEWDTSAARRRCVHAATPAGASVLAARRQDWRDFARGMRAVLGPGVAEEFG